MSRLYAGLISSSLVFTFVYIYFLLITFSLQIHLSPNSLTRDLSNENSITNICGHDKFSDEYFQNILLLSATLLQQNGTVVGDQFYCLCIAIILLFLSFVINVYVVQKLYINLYMIFVHICVFTYCCILSCFRNVCCVIVRTLSLGLRGVKIPWHDERRLLDRTIKASSLQRKTNMFVCIYLCVW